MFDWKSLKAAFQGLFTAEKPTDDTIEYPPKTETPPPTPPSYLSKQCEWTLELLKALEWKRYEDFCVQYLIEQGCRAEVTSLGADGGIDIKVFEKHGDRPIAVAQCKAWGTKKVNVDLIRALFGVMAAERVPHGIYLTTSDFTSEARAFAEGKPLQLINGLDFLGLIQKLPQASQQRLMDFATQGDYTTPTCVRCGTKMVLRENKKEQRKFWGCANYPRCRMTINIRAQP